MNIDMNNFNEPNIKIPVKGKEILNLSLKNSKVRIREKTKNGDIRKMKIHIDLSKEESEGYKSFMDLVKPEELNEQEFIKIIFLKGVEAVNQQLTAEAKKYFEQNPEILSTSGSPTSKIEVL
jgi:pantothenate kinase type III